MKRLDLDTSASMVVEPNIPAKCVLDTFHMLTAWHFEMDGKYFQKLHHGQYGDRTHDIRVISTTL